MTGFCNARYFGQDLHFHTGGFQVNRGRIQAVGSARGGIDLGGRYIIPGLVDIHTHGCEGLDFSAVGPDGLRKMAALYARQGVAAFCPTSMSLPEDMLQRAFANAADLAEDTPCGCARVVGIHMEGPFIEPSRRGAQNATYILAPDGDMFTQLQGAARGWIKILSLAPELPGAEELARAAGGCVLSVAHTSADYEAAAWAFDNGFSHVAHLFNAMTPFSHRAPGILGAAAERPHVTAEVIADGIHLHPSTVRLAFALFGPQRICLVSDSIEACGMPDGAYQLGGQRVTLKAGRVTLPDGTIAGAATSLARCLRNTVGWGIPIEAAVSAASANPAKKLDIFHEYGCIADGRRADFLICSQNLDIEQIFMDGERIA